MEKPSISFSEALHMLFLSTVTIHWMIKFSHIQKYLWVNSILIILFYIIFFSPFCLILNPSSSCYETSERNRSPKNESVIKLIHTTCMLLYILNLLSYYSLKILTIALTFLGAFMREAAMSDLSTNVLLRQIFIN